MKTKSAKLPNGLRLIHLHTPRDPISAAHLFMPGGASLEKAHQFGITTLHWSLLLKGTTKRSARELAEAIESIGASLGAGASHDYSEVSCHSVSDYFGKAMELMGECLFSPSYPDVEVAKEKGALIAAIRSKKESIFTLASEELSHQLFGDHSYARPVSGEEKTLSTLTAEDILKWHSHLMNPEGAILVVATDMTFAKTLAIVKKVFGHAAWGKKRKQVALRATKPISALSTVRRMEHFEQAYLMIGFAAPSLTSKEYTSIKVLSSCLGGGMSARFFQELREKMGLAYDVGAYYASRKAGSGFVIYMGLQANRLDEAKTKIHAILSDVAERGLAASEIDDTKNYLKGTYILDHQTNSQRAHYLGWWEILGLGSAYDGAYLKRIDQITVKSVSAAAKKLLNQPYVTVEIWPKKLKPEPTTV